MKLAIRLLPLGGGEWRWTVGRSGITALTGQGESLEVARDAAEQAALEYAEDAQRAHFYLYDTSTQARIELAEHAKEG